MSDADRPDLTEEEMARRENYRGEPMIACVKLAAWLDDAHAALRAVTKERDYLRGIGRRCEHRTQEVLADLEKAEAELAHEREKLLRQHDSWTAIHNADEQRIAELEQQCQKDRAEAQRLHENNTHFCGRIRELERERDDVVAHINECHNNCARVRTAEQRAEVLGKRVRRNHQLLERANAIIDPEEHPEWTADVERELQDCSLCPHPEAD